MDVGNIARELEKDWVYAAVSEVLRKTRCAEQDLVAELGYSRRHSVHDFALSELLRRIEDGLLSLPFCLLVVLQALPNSPVFHYFATRRRTKAWKSLDWRSQVVGD